VNNLYCTRVQSMLPVLQAHLRGMLDQALDLVTQTLSRWRKRHQWSCPSG